MTLTKPTWRGFVLMLSPYPLCRCMYRFLLVAIAVLTATESFGKVATIQLTNLIGDSELIVVATVKSVSFPLFGKRYAKAEVTEVWKGTAATTIDFLASPTWTCDTSKAVSGETVLLFLKKSGKSRSYLIAHSGRGRLPLRTVADRTCVGFWSEVRLPKEIATIDDPASQVDSVSQIEITQLRDFVKKVSHN
jgi:hypothetical protein